MTSDATTKKKRPALTGDARRGDLPARASAWTITLLVAATFGIGMATVVPMAFSLAVRIDELAPGRTELLGYVLGIGSAATLLFAPLTGILSDRTRSRWGRRKPFTIGGLVIGAAAMPVLVWAPNVPALCVGWVIATVGWGAAGGSIGNWQADRLPPSQRGQVSGLTTLAMQVSPVLGILLVSLVRNQTPLIFVIPAAVATALILLFVVFVRDPDSRHLAAYRRLTVGGVLRSYLFRPKDVPDFAWNWTGRFVFFLGLTLTTSFTVFFYAQRLELSVPDVAGIMALTSALSLATALLGSVGGGWVSDRIGRRKPLVFAGALLFACGAMVSAFAFDLPSLLVGSLISSLGIALFTAVGQAVVLDVLPHRETQAGRYMAITMFSQKIPGVIAPLAAPALLGLGQVGASQNFVVLYVSAAALALVGGLIVTFAVRGIR